MELLMPRAQQQEGGRCDVPGTWPELRRALAVFHPLRWRRDEAATTTGFQWSGRAEVDVLAAQLMALAATVWFAEHCTTEWPWFVRHLGGQLTAHPHLVRAWNTALWMDPARQTLPWRHLLPAYLVDLLPYVLLHVLVSWSDVVAAAASAAGSASLWTAYVEAVLVSHGQWIGTARQLIDRLSAADAGADYAAGHLLDAAALGRLNAEVRDRVVGRCPVAVLRSLQQSALFGDVDADLRTAVGGRLGV